MKTEKLAFSRRNLQRIFDKVVELDAGLELRLREAMTEAINATITRVIGQAPEALDTLEELARALDNDDSAAAGLIQQIAGLRADLTKINTTVDTLVNAEPYTDDDIDSIVLEILAEEAPDDEDIADENLEDD